MKVRIIIRKVESKPPTKQQRSYIHSEMYAVIQAKNRSTQNKTVVQTEKNIFVLRGN